MLSNKYIYVMSFMVRGLKLIRIKVPQETNKEQSRERKTNKQLGTNNRNE